MLVFIVDDQTKEISAFLEAIKARGWSEHAFPCSGAADSESVRRFLREVCDRRPDVVLLDAALTEDESKLLDDYQLTQDELPDDAVSGFRYCRALSSERLGIPIVVFTRWVQGNVARAAMRSGADRVITKASRNDIIIRQLEELVRGHTSHDPEFYWPLRVDLESRPEAWHGDALGKALDRFFLNASSVRRFGLFTASLRSTLSPLFRGDADAEKKLVVGLVKSQVLLSLVDPRLRDHVKHTGNVFWMGLRLLRDIPDFAEPQRLSGAVPGLYPEGGPLTPREQLLHSWTLASLFHDFGYVDERQVQLGSLVSGLVPGADVKLPELRNRPRFAQRMRTLRDWAKQHLGQDHFLPCFIDHVTSSFGSEMECRGGKGKKILGDHGFVGAYRLLEMIPFDQLDPQRQNIVLHAAVAIACHNHLEMLRKWSFEPGCQGNLEIGQLPVHSLLTFCDSVQTWDRETDHDPATAKPLPDDDLLERLVMFDTAYVSGSEIREFTIRPTAGGGHDLDIRIRYFVELGHGIGEVCEALGDQIDGWIASERLADVCRATGISRLLRGAIAYDLPMLTAGKTARF